MVNHHIRLRARWQPAFLAGIAFLTCRAAALENPYDVVGKALTPLVKVFVASTKPHNQGLIASLAIEQATGLPSEAVGQQVDLEIQCPDKFRLRSNVLGEQITICRTGQEIWAYPGAQISALIENQKLPKADPEYRLEPFRLPVTEKQLVFLPALFQVRDGGLETVSGEECRVINLVLMPELASSLKAQDWSARLWVRADYQLAKIELIRPGWRAAFSVKKLAAVSAFPEAIWVPAADQASDTLRVTPVRFKQLVEAITESFTTAESSK